MAPANVTDRNVNWGVLFIKIVDLSNKMVNYFWQKWRIPNLKGGPNMILSVRIVSTS